MKGGTVSRGWRSRVKLVPTLACVIEVVVGFNQIKS